MHTHGVKINFGKHKGELFTRLPVSYLKWMINAKTKQCDIAKAEFERRGDTMPTIELSGHAIDNASLRVRKIWQNDRRKDEGLYSWLMRVTLEAIDKNGKQDLIHYKGMKLAIAYGSEFPTLKTVMRIE